MPADPRPRGRFASLLLTRPAGFLAAVALLLILLGCMSISIGKFSGTGSGCTAEADGIFCQEGEATLAAGELREVYFPAPYAHLPNLEVSDTFHNCVLLHQREDSFSVRNDASYSVTVSWKARGMRAAPLAGPPPPPPEPHLPPPAPVPSESTGKER
jgi:hypothetical protein